MWLSRQRPPSYLRLRQAPFPPEIRPINRVSARCNATLSSTLAPKFPGAINSPLVTKLEFITPSQFSIIPTYRVMSPEGMLEDRSRPPVDVTDDQVVTWYKNMLSVSIMDTIMFEAQRHGRLSFYMVSAGEEAVTVGSAAALGPDDVITCQYRETGVFQQRGFTLHDFMSQLTSNRNDPGKGRNMPVHYSGKKKVGAHTVASTLGTQIPHAAGAAYALKMENIENPTEPGKVAAAYFGEGAASEGDFHGALNMAATRGCPVLFFCRNNGYAISTPSSEQYRGDGIASRGMGYGIDTLRVDGTDIFAVYEAVKEARRRALEGSGRPILLEFMSYRVHHHSTSDDSFAYRSRGEVDLWKGRGHPIARTRRWLENNGLWDDALEEQTRTDIRKAVLQELHAAEKEKRPPLKDVFTDIYAELTEEAEEQRQELKRLLLKYPEEYDCHEYEGGIGGL